MPTDESPEMPADPFKLTDLERVENAHIGCRAAWLYPFNPDLLRTAAVACEDVGFNYVELVAATIEAHDKASADNVPPMEMTTARLRVAESFHALSMKMVAEGHNPREAGPQDFNYTDPDDYGSLA